MVQRRWHFQHWTIWLLLKKTTWSSGSYKKYELLNHFVCSKDNNSVKLNIVVVIIIINIILIIIIIIIIIHTV